ncbi:hypothetical protein LTR41_002451 [Exophiala xenobiotica]|nr:hypothetical protein LTR41_002451 [Exophiala xenobiotica]
MEFLSPANHIACQSFQRFMIETFELRAGSACTCLTDGRDILCQRYPDLAAQIVIFYAQAEKFRRAFLPSSQNAESAREREICFNVNESTTPDSIGPSPTLDSRTDPVERDDSLLVSAVEHYDFPDFNYNQGQANLDALPCLETNSETYTLPFKEVNAANDEEASRSIDANCELGDPNPGPIIPSHKTVYTDFHFKSGEDQSFDKEPGPESDITSNRKVHTYGTEHTSDTQDHRSHSIGFVPFSPEEQGLRQRRTLPMNFEDSSEAHEEERESEAQGTAEEGMKNKKPRREYRNVAESDSGKPQKDESQQEDEAQQEYTDEHTDQEECQTSSASPIPVRQKKLKNSTRRAPANSIGRERRSASHQSNNDLLRILFLRALPQTGLKRQPMWTMSSEHLVPPL